MAETDVAVPVTPEAPKVETKSELKTTWIVLLLTWVSPIVAAALNKYAGMQVDFTAVLAIMMGGNAVYGVSRTYKKVQEAKTTAASAPEGHIAR
ncbi:MAG: hypothetical protein PHY56_00270 [Candidatus Omnitrophica bacterium]|nr:hypothetical protein [Candidatus Omnitrophota bacterium]